MKFLKILWKYILVNFGLNTKIYNREYTRNRILAMNNVSVAVISLAKPKFKQTLIIFSHGKKFLTNPSPNICRTLYTNIKKFMSIQAKILLSSQLAHAV